MAGWQPRGFRRGVRRIGVAKLLSKRCTGRMVRSKGRLHEPAPSFPLAIFYDFLSLSLDRRVTTFDTFLHTYSWDRLKPTYFHFCSAEFLMTVIWLEIRRNDPLRASQLWVWESQRGSEEQRDWIPPARYTEFFGQAEWPPALQAPTGQVHCNRHSSLDRKLTALCGTLSIRPVGSLRCCLHDCVRDQF